ncbi:MAG: hypothetical protein AAF533_28420 [Acidobacteriota bacterium]
MADGASKGAETGETGANRKLIRPSLATHAQDGPRQSRRRRSPPAEDDTGAEASRLQTLMHLGTPLLVTLEDGEAQRGVLEWYDRDCLKLRRDQGPSIVIMKQAILHLGQDPQASAPRRGGRRGRRS